MKIFFKKKLFDKKLLYLCLIKRYETNGRYLHHQGSL